MDTAPAAISKPAARAGDRIAAIDVGTNSIRLVVAEPDPDGSYRLLADERVVARLGRGMTRSRRLDPAAMTAAAQATAHLAEIARGYGAHDVLAIATCAVREARNQTDFLDLVRREAGVDLEVISGEEEARLAFLSVQYAFAIDADPVAVIDIGGGSTEIVLAVNGVIDQIESLPLGAVRLTERVAHHEAEDRLEKLRKRVAKRLRKRLPRPVFPARMMVGTGGTFTSLAQIEMLARGGRPAGDAPLNVRGFKVSRADLRHHIERLNAMDPEARANVAGLSPERAEIIVAGLVIAEGAMRQLRLNELIVHDRGIRDGLLLRLVDRMYPDAARSPGPPDRIQAVRRFAERCHYDREHSEHVAVLALAIFSTLR